jgi:4-amino-4-deoxy-L-arabinose transferase-like glycosyltransferase
MNTTAPVVAGSSPGRPSWFASGTAIISYVAIVRVLLYMIAAPNYGYFRDELYYLACGEHPAWGYVDQPPLIGWIAWLLQHSIGTSLWALRLLPMLACVASVIFAGLLARELGGRRWAMFLAALSALVAPVMLALSHLFTMNAFDPLLWTAIAYTVVRIVKTGNERLWITAGVLVGLTILNKYGVLFWISGLLIGVLLTPLRQSLRRVWFWLGCALAVTMTLPNFLWQWSYQFPFLQLMHNVRQHHRDVALAPFAFLQAQAQMLGFVAAVLVPCALIFSFSRQGRLFRTLGWAYVVLRWSGMG